MAEGTQRGKPGRKPALDQRHINVLRAITKQQPRSPLDEVTRELHRRTGMSVCTVTVRKALRQAGIERAKPQRRPSERAAVQGGAPLRVGYTDAHRREDGPSGMNTDLTDAEWALVADLFERNGGRGAPPKHSRKSMVDACAYVVCTGCAWRLLPKSFPPWRGVYKAFSRWAAAGTFEAMHERLRQQWRDRIGRDPEPTVAIIDAQSTRSTAQGGMTGFDAGKKVKGRKRHLVVDTLGLLLAVTVTSASVQDRDAAAPVVAQAMANSQGAGAAAAVHRRGLRWPLRAGHRGGAPRAGRASRSPPRQSQHRHLERRSATVVARGRAQWLRRADQALGRRAHPRLERARAAPHCPSRPILMGAGGLGLVRRSAYPRNQTGGVEHFGYTLREDDYAQGSVPTPRRNPAP